MRLDNIKLALINQTLCQEAMPTDNIEDELKQLRDGQSLLEKDLSLLKASCMTLKEENRRLQEQLKTTIKENDNLIRNKAF